MRGKDLLPDRTVAWLPQHPAARVADLGQVVEGPWVALASDLQEYIEGKGFEGGRRISGLSLTGSLKRRAAWLVARRLRRGFCQRG